MNRIKSHLIIKNLAFVCKLCSFIASIVFVVCLLIAGCKKKTYDTNGWVLDATNSNGISNAKVHLLKNNINCFTCPSKEIASTITDATGYFTLGSFKDESGFSYSVTAEAENYFNNFYTGGVPVSSSNNAIIKLMPEGYLCFKIKNVAPYDGNDIFGINGDWQASAPAFFGMGVDTSFVIKIKGNKTIAFVWQVIKNNISNNYEDSIYCKAFDTTFYAINY